MATKSFASHLAAFLFALGSFVLAFFLLVDLGFMVAYFASGGGGSGWWGPAWRKFIHDVVQAGPMAAFIGWAALTTGTALLGHWLAAPDRRTKAGISLASMAARLSNCGMMGAGVAVSILVSLVGCRVIWFR
jgi:hypothetical protein